MNQVIGSVGNSVCTPRESLVVTVDCDQNASQIHLSDGVCVVRLHYQAANVTGQTALHTDSHESRPDKFSRKKSPSYLLIINDNFSQLLVLYQGEAVTQPPDALIHCQSNVLQAIGPFTSMYGDRNS